MIYEYECPVHGPFERRMSLDEMEEAEARGNRVCPHQEIREVGTHQGGIVMCLCECEMLVSVPQIEPDPFWSGQGEFRNLREKKEHSRNHFSPTRNNIEQVQRNKRARRRATAKRRHDTVVDIVRNIDNP